MDEEIKCPVCGKPGIPDYHNKDVVCPQCGADLKIFRVIDQIPQPKSHKSNVWKPIATVAILATVAIGAYVLLTPPKIVNPDNQSELITQLQDSIMTLNNEITTLSKETNTHEGAFRYVIKKGDSYWKISYKVFGTGTRYTEILEYNGLNEDSPLIVGDTILIKQ